MTDLSPVIEQATAAKEFHRTHVVTTISELGLHWFPDSEEACRCLAGVIGESAMVLPIDRFISDLYSIIPARLDATAPVSQ